MARIALATQVIDNDGLNPAYTAGTDVGATYLVDADADHIEVVNGSGASVNVTIETGGTVSGIALADVVVAVPAAERRKIKLRDKRLYPRPSGVSDAGKIYVNLSAVTTVTAGAFR